MNSEESVLSLMPIKYPYLFPNTIRLSLNEINKRFHINMDVNRKPSHSYFFKGDFDGQGNILNIENLIFTKYILTSKQKEGKVL